MAEPTFRTEPWLNIVLAMDKEYYELDPAYEFSNKREFKSSDKGSSGVYGDEE